MDSRAKPNQSPRAFGGVTDIAHLASNALSLGIVALAGIAFNSILAFGADVRAVGQFNQLFALHVVAAQLAAFGIHLSCLHYLSEQPKGTKSWAAGAQSAMAAVAGTGAAVGICVWLSAAPIERLLDSQGLAAGIRWVGPGVALFGVNKVLFAICNAGDRLHLLAMLQALRPLVWLSGAVVLVSLGNATPGPFGMVLFAGELAAMLLGIACLPQAWIGPVGSDHQEWLRRHLRFGIRAMPSNLVIDLNTRIDVLLLAYFMSDAIVGVYSFVAVLAEGVFQVGVVIRTVINRRLVGVLVSRDHAGLRRLRHQTGRWSLAGTLLLAGAIGVGFAPAVSWLGLDRSLFQGQYALWILLAGVVACAVHSPIWMLLLLAGRPAAHTQLMLALCALNILLNIALIPAFGMLGAAIGTAVMFAAFPPMLTWTANKVLGMKL